MDAAGVLTPISTGVKHLLSLHNSRICYIFLLVFVQAVPALGADAELDALNLEIIQETNSKITSDTKLFLEGSFGNADKRDHTGGRKFQRTSIDFSHSARVAENWRAVISDRLDVMSPADLGTDRAINSLREGYLSWQSGEGRGLLEFGRINMRYGPGYGYNPTDFFRDGALRSLSTADPVALRGNRLGSVMVRAQSMWADGALSVTYSPKLADRPTNSSWSLDLGSTNNRDRGMLALSSQISQHVSSQFLIYKDDGLTPALGANMTALLSDSIVGHMEWSRATEPDLLSRAFALPSAAVTRNRFVAGMNYTAPSKWSITSEYQYNGFGLTGQRWAELGVKPFAQLAYLSEAIRLQELAQRQAYLLYVTKKSFYIENLNLTAYLQFNPDDRSRLAWLEMRHHWRSFDLSIQIQQSFGDSTGVYGVLPDRRVVQILGSYYL